MKGILIAQKPRDCEKIVSGKKTIIVCKKMPKLQTPFKGYIFCTKGKPFIQKIRFGDIAISHTQISKNLYNGRVIGEFICDKVYLIKNQGSMFSVADEEQSVTNEIARQSCLDYYDMVSYLGNKDGYGWHITDLKIYDKPKELSEFRKLKERIEQTCGCLSNNGLCNAARYEELCDNIKKCCFKEPNAPKGWCYVQELEERK